MQQFNVEGMHAQAEERERELQAQLEGRRADAATHQRMLATSHLRALVEGSWSALIGFKLMFLGHAMIASLSPPVLLSTAPDSSHF